MNARVIGVASDPEHRFGKTLRTSIALLPGLGVAGDAHCGAAVQHRSRRRVTPDAANLRQVHLLQVELLDELRRSGFSTAPGKLGENVTTSGIDLLALPRGTRLSLGQTALVELTGLRNPCRQIDENIAHGAMAALLARASDGSLVRKAGVMAVVIEGGMVRPGDPIAVQLPAEPHDPLAPV